MYNIVTEQPKQQQSIEDLKQSCKRAIDTTEMNFVIIGERLNELKEEMKKDGSNFREWLEQDTRITYSTANRYMKVAEGYRTREHTDENKLRKHVGALGIKKAYLLLKITDIDERYRFIKDNEIRYKSYETTNELLEKHLNINHSDVKNSSNNKDALDKFERNLIKEIKKYSEIIDNLDTDTPIIYHDIKVKLIELQELLTKSRDYDIEVPKGIYEDE